MLGWKIVGDNKNRCFKFFDKLAINSHEMLKRDSGLRLYKIKKGLLGYAEAGQNKDSHSSFYPNRKTTKSIRRQRPGSPLNLPRVKTLKSVYILI